MKTLHEVFMECLETEEKYIHVENGGDFFLKREGSTLKILFEWSDGFEDWLNNFRFLAIPKKPYNNMIHPWFCHRGFYEVFRAILPYIKEEIMNPKNEKIEIIGYSHGAAIALLCYEYCVFNRPEIEVQGVGFGCPRVFWGIVPKAVKERFNNFLVVRNVNDIVTHVPPVLFGYRHISKVLKIGTESKGLINDHREVNYINNLKNLYEVQNGEN